MTQRAPFTLPWTGTALAAEVRWELRNQLTVLAGLSLWLLLPVVLLTTSGLLADIDTRLLLGWSVLALLQTAAGYLNHRINRRRLARHDDADNFSRRNTLYYACLGTVWGLLPLMAALWGTERAAWFTLLVLLSMLTALVLILSTSHRIFHGALMPSGLLLLASVWLGPVYSPQLFVLSSIYLVALALMHNMLFEMQVERVRSSLQHAAEASALANTLEHHDALTQLYNRAGLQQWLTQRIGSTDYAVANVALASVRGLSDINELYGSVMADTLLRQLALKLIEHSDEHVGAARLGGAEFLLVDIAVDADPERLSQLLATIEHEPFILAGRRIHISLQQVTVQGSARDLEALVRAARALLPGLRNQCSDESLPSRSALVTGFDAALCDGRIQPWFQPIMSCTTGAIVDWEALVRWEHPDFGLLPPDAFLDIARISGQASQLTHMMFRSSAQFLAQLQAAGCAAAAQVSVNFTASDLASHATMEWVQATLAEYGLRPSQVTIEIPEKEALLQDQSFSNNLLAMREAGMLLAIDDFGTGYANLGHLLDLPAATVKIDRRFVEKLPEDKHSIALVRAILTMAQSMGMRTVAEGVERTEQLEFLRENGCDACQGFLGGNAMPAAAAITFAREHAAALR